MKPLKCTSLMIQISFFFLLVNCSSKEERANKLFVEAKRAEQSGNIVYAYDLYEKVIKEFPETQVAVKCIEYLPQIKETVFRYDVKLDPISYPQDEPDDLLKSVSKCLTKKNYAYLMAHLTEPDGFDDRTKFDQILQVISDNQDFQTAYDEWISVIDTILQTKQEGSRSGNRLTYIVKDGADVSLIYLKSKWYLLNS